MSHQLAFAWCWYLHLSLYGPYRLALLLWPPNGNWSWGWPELGCSHVPRMLQWWWMLNLGLHVSVHSSSPVVAAGLSLLLFEKFCSQSSSKSQRAVSICFCVSPQSLNCWYIGMYFQKVLSEVPYLMCVCVVMCH